MGDFIQRDGGREIWKFWRTFNFFGAKVVESECRPLIVILC